jgi:hypothetical protein
MHQNTCCCHPQLCRIGFGIRGSGGMVGSLVCVARPGETTVNQYTIGPDAKTLGASQFTVVCRLSGTLSLSFGCAVAGFFQ